MPYLGRRFRPVLSVTAAVCLASGAALAMVSQPHGAAVAHSHPQRHERPLTGGARNPLAASQAVVVYGDGGPAGAGG
jgi:hypothetical protein